uniref:NOL1/NOP2/Sun domain family member 4 n=2 Tax=Crassostrea virginica TaxID=6565 RepID=A0A8B8AV73_CRAVI|nr:5-methylcytosine rRNA methyltransferase NSUN4-like isoform X1 [Crassostrea virginica]
MFPLKMRIPVSETISTSIKCSSSYILRPCQQTYYIQRRGYKKKWAKNEGSKPYTVHALNHMETFYKPVFKNLWPSIRISLLTTSKYCALLNNYNSESDKVENYLKDFGAYNAMEEAASARKKYLEKENKQILIENSSLPLDSFLDFPKRPQKKEDENDEYNNESFDETEEEAVDKIEPVVGKNTSLHDFIPTKKVFSEKELLQQQIVSTSTFSDSTVDVPIKVIQEQVPELPNSMKFFVYPKGDVSNFPNPKMKHGDLLGYYLLDATSLLPVVALDIQERDSVLDLCAAPGGKTLAMLQTLQTENITCNDESWTRLGRLRDIAKWYLGGVPSSMSVSRNDGKQFVDPLYDKVLVDVPCNTDRHVLISEDNNLFKPGRVDERLNLPSRQRDLLIAGIQSCKPGGTIVYSTCTLSPAQNDGVIQATMEHLWKETEIDSVVIDLSYLRPIFASIFSFFPETKYGQLVIPSLSSNFGPMYICKIKRIR